VAVLAVVPALTGNYLRPLRGERSVFVVPREEQYFAERPELRPVVQRVSDDLLATGCSEVGLLAGFDAPEYLLRLGRSRDLSGLRFEHLAPRSRSGTLAAGRAPLAPCAVVVFNRPSDYGEVAGPLGLKVRWYEQDVGMLTP
jgi:hypothetical protein